MKKITLYRKITTVIIFGVLLTSCKKYLDVKSDQRLQIPSTIEDLQGLLDNYTIMNFNLTPLGEEVSDNYFLTSVDYRELAFQGWRNVYTLKPDFYIGVGDHDWSNEYAVVYQSNVVLDYLPKIEKNALNATAWDNCKGQALAFRAKTFFELAQVFAAAYNPESANSDLGIPLRMTSDFNVKSVRASVKNTYDQIISDCQAALPLLPKLPVFVFRPSKAFVYGLLARTYLIVQDFDNAKKYADSCLSINNQLVNYNTLDTALSRTFAPYQYTNPEQIIYSSYVDGMLYAEYTGVDSGLYRSYNINDLRKYCFFHQNSDGTQYFSGSYGGNYPFNGIATDEIYLIKAEAEARLGDGTSALNDLNTLLKTRWKSGTFIPYTATTNDEALNIILSERRKELCFRAIRLSDIKRLNVLGGNISIAHGLNGQIFTLKANDPKMALEIPTDVIQLSGIQQNPGY